MNLRERIAQGDRKALAEAFVSYRSLVYRMLADRRRPNADWDDIVQESFIRLPDCARHCAPDTSMGGCVATAVHQALRTFDNRSATSDQTRPGRASRRVEVDPAELDRPSDDHDPEEAFLLRERTHLLSELVLQMPAGQRRVLLAREVEGLSNEAAAARLGISPTSVGTLTYRARAELERRAADSPLAEVFAAMPKHGERGQSRQQKWRRRKKLQAKSAA